MPELKIINEPDKPLRTMAYYSTAEAAQILHIAPATLRKWIKEGRIEARRLGRRILIDYSELIKLIEN